MESILLASGSPRRSELLASAGIAFRKFDPDIDESICDGLPPAERVLALAESKARAAILAVPATPRFVLAADTLVCLPNPDAEFEELALGKPENAAEASRMMGLLAGRTHVVRTGIALLDRASGELRTSRSDSAISFAPMSDEEIEAYVASGEWAGAAGAYRIQGRAAFYIDRLEGSWTGVVGLPMRELYVILRDAGFRVPMRG